jgi:hypothetical protein
MARFRNIQRCQLAAFASCLGLLLMAAGVFAQPTSPDPAALLLQSQPQVDTSSPVEATATFDPPVVRPGGTATYRVTFNAMLDSIRWPEEVIAPRQLELENGGRAQIFASTGTNLQPRSTINTRVRATSEGEFTVPRFLVYVYGRPVTVPAATLEVVSDPARIIPTAPAMILELSASNVFIGQPVTARLVMAGNSNGMIQALTQTKLLGEGFIAEQNSVRQRVELMAAGSVSVPTFIYEMDITPITPGPIELRGQGFTAGNQFSGPITITGRATIAGGLPQYVLLDSPAITLNVRPVPQAGRPPGFSGAIGQFKLDSPALATNAVRVGDPVAYTVRVAGQGNLARLVPPPPPEVPGWKIYAGPPDPGPPQLIQARGFIQFNYTLVPLAEKTNATPVIPFSYFDPNTERFVDLSLPSLTINVKPPAVPINIADATEAEAATSDREPEPRLSELATAPGKRMGSLLPWQSTRWFPAAQILPALFFVALWWWDRQRRFHAAHPEVRLRRQARRALQREWAALRKAASLGDTSRFASCAVTAMRIASAPHYPAEPRALVSTDVLPLLADSGTAVHNAVRAVFATANSERFAHVPQLASDLLALRQEVEQALARLEEKLR